MLGSSKAGAVRAVAAPSPARGRDADLYRRYAVGLYRQALLTRDEDDAHDRQGPRVRGLLHAVMRRLSLQAAARARTPPMPFSVSGVRAAGGHDGTVFLLSCPPASRERWLRCWWEQSGPWAHAR